MVTTSATGATNVATSTTTKVNNTNSNSNDPYAGMFQASMANDYFGSQVFGSNPIGFGQPQAVNQNPTNAASAILAQYQMANQGAGGGNYMQDFAMATMIANKMSQTNNVLWSPYTSFTENDVFASQMFGPNGRGLCYIG